MRLDDLVRAGLAEGAGTVRFDANGWTDTVTEAPPVRGRVRLPRAPRPPGRWVAAVAVAALILVGMGVPLALLSGLGGGEQDVRPGGPTLNAYGMRMDLPEGWDGRIVGPAGTEFGPYLHAANFPLPPKDDDVASNARAGMTDDQVTIVLIDVTTALARDVRGSQEPYPPLEGKLQVGPEDLGDSLESGYPGDAHARREFSIEGRSFFLHVEWGASTASPERFSVVNEVLATFRAEPALGTSGYKTQADVDDGLSIRIPEPWTFHQDPSGPDDPRTVFAVGSWTFTKGGECAPVAAQEELPADGTLFWLIEYHDVADPAEFPVRPEHFELDEGTYAQYECSLVPSYLVRFQENGRYFQVHVAFGPQASESLQPEVVRALESIHVTAPVPDECPADTGPWSDPDCPLPAWTRAVVEEVGYEVTGDTGSALIVEGLGGEFAIWATSQDFTAKHLVEEEGYREAYVIDGVLTYSDGVRMVWMVQGLAVWVSGWQVGEPAPGEPPPGPIVADLVDASRRVDYDAIDTR